MPFKYLITWFGKPLTCNGRVLACEHGFHCRTEEEADAKVREITADKANVQVIKWALVEVAQWGSDEFKQEVFIA